MGKSSFVCGKCGKISNLPDYCCSQAMVAKGSFCCESCGRSSANPTECCGSSMKQC